MKAPGQLQLCNSFLRLNSNRCISNNNDWHHTTETSGNLTCVNIEATLEVVKGRQMIHIPIETSLGLPSRGMVMARVWLAGHVFTLPLEPDGRGSHWFILPEGATLERLRIEVEETWPEPRVPLDIAQMLNTHPEASVIWDSLTVAARWDWIRWVSSAKTEATRSKRIESIPSRLHGGRRRPCCFNRQECTITEA